MNILTVNDHYFVSGGPERYLFNVTSLLQWNQHSVIPFSVQHKANIETPYSKYFLSPLTSGDEVYFNELKSSPRSMLKLLGRTFYSFEAKSKLRQLLRAESIDIGYLLHFLRWISPSIVDGLHERGVPVVVRVSDYGYLCPHGDFLRDRKICELCLHGNIIHSVRHKCLQGSYAVSGVNLLSEYLHRLLGVMDRIDAFVCPSRFLLSKMKERGIAESKLHHIPTFVDSSRFLVQFDPGAYVLYFGRIAPDKGVEILIDAFSALKKNPRHSSVQLKLAGRSNRGELDSLQHKIAAAHIDDIQFLGELDFEAIQKLIRGCACVVVPSIWYDNMPNTILESFASGKPVIASSIGSLPEIILNEETGLLFEPGNAEHLADRLAYLLDNPVKILEMGRKAQHRAVTEFAPTAHYEKLIQLFRSLR